MKIGDRVQYTGTRQSLLEKEGVIIHHFKSIGGFGVKFDNGDKYVIIYEKLKPIPEKEYVKIISEHYEI